MSDEPHTETGSNFFIVALLILLLIGAGVGGVGFLRWQAVRARQAALAAELAAQEAAARRAAEAQQQAKP